MPGSVKSGLLFSVIGFVSVVLVSFIPLIGAFLCSPATAGLVGLGAGYFGVKWATPEAGVGTGTVAGLIAGVGLLLGVTAYFVLIVNLPGTDEMFMQIMEQQLSNQPSGADVDPAAVAGMLVPVAIFMGFCFGLIQLLISLGLGALGGWLVVRNRAQVSEYNQQPPMSPPPSSGPPPMSPMS